MIKSRLTISRCSRCHRPLTVSVKSLLGLDTLKEKWGILCADCITAEEQHQLLSEQGLALSGGSK